MSAAHLALLFDAVKKAKECPLDENPYKAYHGALLGLINTPMSNAWFLWAYCVITLLIISTLFAAITLVCRYRTNTLWFYKTKTFSSANRSLILPNITVVFSTLSIAFNAFSIPHDIAMIMAYKHVERANDVYQRLYSFVLPLMVCGLITELHGIAILLYLSRPKIPTFFGIKIFPLAINLFFMSLYLAATVIIFVAFTLMSNSLSEGLDLLRILFGAIKSSDVNWISGQPFAYDESWTGLLLGFAEHFVGVFIPRIRIAYRILLVVILVLTLLFIPCAFAYLRILSQQLKTLQEPLQTEHSGRSRRACYLKRCYWLMVVEIGVVLATATAYTILLSQFAFHFDEIILSPLKFSILLACMITIYPVLGLVLNTVLLLRALFGQAEKSCRQEQVVKALPRTQFSYPIPIVMLPNFMPQQGWEVKMESVEPVST